MMMATFRLLCVIEATTVTGPAKNLLNFCRLARSPDFQAAMRARVEVSIVTFHRLRGRSYHNGQERQELDNSPNSFVAAARAEGIEVDVIEERFRFDPRIIWKLRRVVRSRAPHIIQTHMVKSHFLVMLSGLGQRHLWVAYHHGYTTTDWKMVAYNQLNRWSLPSAARVITVCSPFAEELARTGVPADRIVICHNSVVAPRRVTNEELRALREKLGVAEGERLVLAVGRLSREKGHADLVRAVAILRGLNSELKWKLVIVGDGSERGRVERMARAKGVEQGVFFTGQIDDVEPYYAIADVLALPSRSEGSPNVLLEAMATGLPVVAMAVGGVPEIVVNEKSALLVRPGDVGKFAAALNRLLTDAPLARRLATEAAGAVAGFSPEAYAGSLVRIYRGLVPDVSVSATSQTRSD
jgi:glycosyltransferase involved in cell wall biosynthesis